jgi:gamma-glutamyltranspeptidase/glutathione hydrolase
MSVPFDIPTEKKPVFGSRGVVVANHPLGSAAGLEILALGGNAIDAAISALFALSVVEPMMVGLFGAGWMNIRLADGTGIIVDNYATAPQEATPDLFTPISDSWPEYMETQGQANQLGHLAVATPGTLKAWAEAVEAWGRLDLETVVQPAIRYARKGFPVSGYLAELIQDHQADLSRFPATSRLFLPDDRPLRAGDRLIQPELAESLSAVAAQGADVLYDGPLGQSIVDHVWAEGGILSMEDLRSYRTIRRSPLTISYRGYEVIVPPPPCAGGVHLLQILRLLQGYDLGRLGFSTGDGFHLLAECFKIAFADRAAHLADPEQAEVPLEWLLSEEYAEQRRSQIELGRAIFQPAGVPPLPESATTTHVTSADSDGNVACLTQTINHAFGSKVLAPGTGVLLNNCMALFDPHPGQTNSVAPGRRTISSMTPTIVLRGDRPVLALGTPGGVRIFPSVLQALVNVIDHGMSLQAALEAPRIWTQGQELEVEQAITASARHDLRRRGHDVVEVKTVAGGMNGVHFDSRSGLISGSACWRADGTPMALSGGWARPGIRFDTEAKRS